MVTNQSPRLGTSLGDKLKKIFPDTRPKTKRPDENRSPLMSPMSRGVDGDDHVNIWDRGNTDLGRALAHSTQIPFTHSIFGRFNSLETFWHYIRSRECDDRIRGMSGKPLMRFVEKLTQLRVPNFRAAIMDANWQKVQQYPELAESIKESKVPFDCYYIYKRKDGVRIRPTFAYWIIGGFEEIRKALIEEREPNFDFLKDTRNIGIYDGILKRLNLLETKPVEKVVVTEQKPPQKAKLFEVKTPVTETESDPEPVKMVPREPLFAAVGEAIETNSVNEAVDQNNGTIDSGNQKLFDEVAMEEVRQLMPYAVSETPTV